MVVVGCRYCRYVDIHGWLPLEYAVSVGAPLEVIQVLADAYPVAITSGSMITDASGDDTRQYLLIRVVECFKLEKSIVIEDEYRWEDVVTFLVR